jgi:quercetin dioxygenase-like cupin family protein
MVILTLADGQEVPWHLHSEVTDTFFCMQGPMRVETRDPPEHFELSAGEICTVPARRAHRVSGKNGGPFKFALLQASELTTPTSSGSQTSRTDSLAA